MISFKQNYVWCKTKAEYLSLKYCLPWDYIYKIQGLILIQF